MCCLKSINCAHQIADSKDWHRPIANYQAYMLLQGAHHTVSGMLGGVLRLRPVCVSAPSCWMGRLQPAQRVQAPLAPSEQLHCGQEMEALMPLQAVIQPGGWPVCCWPLQRWLAGWQRLPQRLQQLLSQAFPQVGQAKELLAVAAAAAPCHDRMGEPGRRWPGGHC